MTDLFFDGMRSMVREVAADAGAIAADSAIARIERHFADAAKGTAAQLRTIDQVADDSPALTKSRLYKWVADAENNGLERALVRKGGRVYIHRQRFDKWLEAK